MSTRYLFKLIILAAAVGATGASARAAPYQAVRPDIAGASVIEKVARRCVYDEDGRQHCRTDRHHRVHRAHRPYASPYADRFYGAYPGDYGYGYGYRSGHRPHHGGHGGFSGHHSGGHH